MRLPYIPNHLLGERGRRNRFGFACFKTEGSTETTDEKQELLDKINGMLETRMTKEAVTAMMNEQFKSLPVESLRAIADEKTGAMAVLKKQGEEIEALKTRSASMEKPKSLTDQIKDWQTRNKAAIEKIKGGEKAELSPLEVRAVASPMTPATVDSGSSLLLPAPYVEPGITDLLRVPPNLWNTIRKGRTNSSVYVWVNKSNPQGAAAFIGPGVAKPGVSFELVTDISNAKKIAVSAKAATELLQDFSGMEDMIRGEMSFKLYDELNAKLMTGVASSTVPAGLRTLSVPYTATSIKIPAPNALDAITAVNAYLRSGLLSGRIVDFINPIDAANIQAAKTAQGVYIFPPFTALSGLSIPGVEIVTDPNIPVGYVQAAFLDYYRVLIYEDFNIKMGWENDDFTRNLVTWIGEMRIHQFFNQAYTGFAIYDTFANIITKIT